MMSSHKIQTTSFRLWALAEADEHRAEDSKTDLKSGFGPVEPEQGVTKSRCAEVRGAGQIQRLRGVKWPF
jgi:hypothetical protein